MAQRARQACAAMMREDQPRSSTLTSSEHAQMSALQHKSIKPSSKGTLMAPVSRRKSLEMSDTSAKMGGPGVREIDEESKRQRKRRRLLTPDPESGADSELEIKPSPRQLPTPPPSQHKRAQSKLRISEFDWQAISSDYKDGLDASNVALPAEYVAVLAQHSALERGLVLHLATEGGRAAGMIASTTTDANGTLHARVPNVLTFSTAKKLIEGGSRKRLGAEELARLKWVWDLSSPLGYTISATKELDSSGKKAPTWAIGIELVVQHHAPQSSLELVGALPASPPRTPTKTGSRDSMSIVALWSQATEARIAQVRKRLGALAIWQLRQAVPPEEMMSVPRAELPTLRTRSLSNGLAPVSASQELLERSSFSPAKPAGSLSNRASTQLERIKAKQAAKAQGLSSAAVTAANGEVDVFSIATPGQKMEELRERSALSRLAGIADGVHLLFTSASQTNAPPSPSMSVPNPPTRKRRAVPLDEMANLVAKSSRTAMSEAEAKDALEMLSRVCPGFVAIREIDRRLWVASVGETTLREAKEAIKSALAH